MSDGFSFRLENSRRGDAVVVSTCNAPNILCLFMDSQQSQECAIGSGFLLLSKEHCRNGETRSS